MISKKLALTSVLLSSTVLLNGCDRSDSKSRDIFAEMTQAIERSSRTTQPTAERNKIPIKTIYATEELFKKPLEEMTIDELEEQQQKFLPEWDDLSKKIDSTHNEQEIVLAKNEQAILLGKNSIVKGELAVRRHNNSDDDFSSIDYFKKNIEGSNTDLVFLTKDRLNDRWHKLNGVINKINNKHSEEYNRVYRLLFRNEEERKIVTNVIKRRQEQDRLTLKL